MVIGFLMMSILETRFRLLCFFVCVYWPHYVQFSTTCSFPTILDIDLVPLGREVSLEETRFALFSMPNLKALGPDGFHPLFFKSQWDHLDSSIFDFVRLCFTDPMRIGQVNNTLLTLIPKGDEPSQASHFRPIALCNVIYKIVTKIITQRLRDIMPYVVAKKQSSFIPGKSTIDNILVLQETINSFMHLNGKKGFTIDKLDLEKAYDRLEWSFLMDTLSVLGLHEGLKRLIFHCISSDSLSIIWNGTPSPALNSSRGLRQGDPISPYLFVLCLERLGHKIKDVVSNRDWVPFTFGRGRDSCVFC